MDTLKRLVDYPSKTGLMVVSGGQWSRQAKSTQCKLRVAVRIRPAAIHVEPRGLAGGI